MAYSRTKLHSNIKNLRNLSGLKDFRNADLQGQDLSNLNLRSADFSGANMKGTKLDGSNISSAVFDSVDLTNASFTGCFGEGPRFLEATLKYVNFARASFLYGVFENVDMSQTTLGFVYSEEYSDLCRFDSCRFTCVSLRDQNLKNFTFRDCAFFQVDMSYCDLIDATFPGSNMIDVEMTGAKIHTTRRPINRVFVERASPSGQIIIEGSVIDD